MMKILHHQVLNQKFLNRQEILKFLSPQVRSRQYAAAFVLVKLSICQKLDREMK